MAPSAVETVTDQGHALKTTYIGQYKALAPVGYSKDAEAGKVAGYQAAKYPHYLPTWDPEQKYLPLLPFEHSDRGVNADTSFPDLLPAGVQKTDLTPTIGTEVRGIQLSKLNDAGKDQLSRLVGERKVVAFRDQDFADLPVAEAVEYGRYFGRLHIHPTSGCPEGFPEVHMVFRGAGDKSHETFFEDRTSSVAWHSDVTYEEQPPCTTFLYILEKPESGGDTLFANAVEAYNRLSPAFRERLHGLKAVHSGFEQINASVANGSIKRREPVSSVHPIVRTHPATGEKALYVNPQFTRGIVGMKKEESDVILKFLFDHIAYGADFQVRVKWEEKTVVIWDNRVTQHSALIDWKTGQRRHLARITPQGERPYETPYAG